MQEGKIINRRKKGGKSELHLQLLSHDLSFHLPSSFLSSLAQQSRLLTVQGNTRTGDVDTDGLTVLSPSPFFFFFFILSFSFFFSLHQR